MESMKQWLGGLLAARVKKPLPILSFPSAQLLGITVRELIQDPAAQAEGMACVAARVDAAAAVSLMDLSLEAECFGAPVRVSDGEVPTVVGRVVEDEASARALRVPEVGGGRTGLAISAVRLAARRIQDRPVFAGIIGPFSLAGRLMDVTEILVACYEDPDAVHLVLEKATQFLCAYAAAFKAAGAHGVLLAEPLAGLLSPALAEEFSAPYCKRIVDAVQDGSFLVLYHNCGDQALRMLDSILSTGAAAYHFGNAVDMAQVMAQMPAGTVAMGNLDPAGQFRNGTPESVREATLELMRACGKYPNFVPSSGCDIPPLADWANIDAFFSAVQEYYRSL